MAGKAKQEEAEVSTGGSLISNAKLQQMYAAMLQCRLLSDRARRLRTSNAAAKMLAACAGHEAIAVGCAIDLDSTDTITLVPHDATAGLGVARLLNGAAMSDLVGQMYANGTRDAAATAEEQLTIATKVAIANKKKKSDNVVVVFAGAETTATSYWDETLAQAASKKLPIIFVVENNREAATVADNSGDLGVALKAQSKAVPRIPVDGSDVVAVYRVSHESLARVRRGDGPALIEGTSYRLSTQAESKKHDPLRHMEQYLTARGLFSAGWKDQLVEQFSIELDLAVKAAKKK
jgi:TPP-dependent pyruvate/acetoin dehydrogenase alpha subunit